MGKRRELHTHRFQMFTLFSANLSKQFKGFTDFVDKTEVFPVETIDTKVPDTTPKESLITEGKHEMYMFSQPTDPQPESEPNLTEDRRSKPGDDDYVWKDKLIFTHPNDILIWPKEPTSGSEHKEKLTGLPAPTKNMQWVDWVDSDINGQVNTCTEIDMPVNWSVTGFSKKYGSVISGFDDMGNKQKYYISDITDGDMLMTDGMIRVGNVLYIADWKQEEKESFNKRIDIINEGGLSVGEGFISF